MFDLIQANYGWDDDKIMALPIRRLRQIVAVVGERQRVEAEERMLLIEWQTRTIAEFTAATVAMPKGKKNPLLAQAQKIRLLPSKGGETTAGKYSNSGDPAPGTYEKFMGTLGRGIIQGRS